LGFRLACDTPAIVFWSATSIRSSTIGITSQRCSDTTPNLSVSLVLRCTSWHPPEGPDPTKSMVHEKYFGISSKGALLTTIDCIAVRVDINNATCKQQWSLEQQGLKVRLTAQYRRPVLQHWREIQPMVSELVLGFRHDPSLSEATPSAPR
jgi:hypothetical protein